MSLILNIETSTEVCSVCLSANGTLLQELESPKAFSHANELTLLIAKLMEMAGYSLKDLDAVAISSGPGSFTGLRVGIAAAKGICFALDKPLINVETLLSLAGEIVRQSEEGAWICPMIDARRMEVYTTLFKPDMVPVWETQAKIIDETSFDSFFKAGQRIAFGGNGAEKCRAFFSAAQSQILEIKCAARHLIPFAEAAFQEKNFEDLASFSPNYLKRPNITVAKKGGPL